MGIKALLTFILLILIIAPLKPKAQINLSDSLALVDFYDSTNGDNWHSNYNNWKTSAPLSQWYGVGVRNNRVVGISMVGNHLTGNIPASFANLDSMKNLYFLDNNFGNDFLPYIANFKDIITIDIAEQFLPGPIPTSWGNLTKLTYLKIYGPNLAGPIPSSLGNLTNLTGLDVQNSRHSGDIPSEALSMLPLNSLTLLGNLYTFKELEPLVEIFNVTKPGIFLEYEDQEDIPTTQRNDELVVSPGGVPQHNTYQWYKSGTGVIATIVGDSTYRPTSPGTYYAAITNSIATQLTLNIVPIKAAAAAVSVCPGQSSVSLVADVSGASYQWQESVGAAVFRIVTDVIKVYTVNTSTLQLLNAPSTWYGRKYRCVANAINSTVFTIYFPNTWISTGTTNWEDATNWSCGKVPDAGTDAIITSGTVILNSNVTVRSLYLANSVTFTVGAGYTLTIRH